ncbi:hypothetical protein B0J18DRAFT_427243 [Chaetomium sp. MPI-SDFR-AT-0129]|nr:hypothetical protein B0J18DRAFT_427243 [Chaetomium sp. MPI-SDFR-AT-0129]
MTMLGVSPSSFPATRRPEASAKITTMTSPRSSQQANLRGRIQDGFIAVVIALLAQLLIAGIQFGLNQESSDFPAPILAMAVVFLVFSFGGVVIPGLEEFYAKRLKRPTELLNRHMSIGFTIPVVMLCHGPLSDARSVGMIVICFALMGLFNTILAFFLAFPLQCLMVRYDKEFWITPTSDSEKGGDHQGASNARTRGPFRKSSPAGSSCTIVPEFPAELSETDEPVPPQPPTATSYSIDQPRPIGRCLHIWAMSNPILVICWLLTFTVGVPLRYCTGNDPLLATLLLFSLWLTTIAIQATIKSSSIFPPRIRTLLSGLLNPVLWTALTMISYVFTDASLSSRSLPAMLATLQTNTPLSSIILHAATPYSQPSASLTMAAGDVAITILNAGLVAWGLKLYAHRTHLLSRSGATVCIVSSVLALANLVGGPVLAARALGVRPRGAAVAFAARSVTIALGNPVMKMLRGDAGLCAAMVVAGGIVYQMGMGLGVGVWLERVVVDRGIARWYGLSNKREGDDAGDCEGTADPVGLAEGDDGTNTATTRYDTGDPIGAAAKAATGPTPQLSGTTLRTVGPVPALNTAPTPTTTPAGLLSPSRPHFPNDPRIVAPGITVGINAAAMGTAYLYEAESEAAPYAALSMIALGVMTVVFASIPPLTKWIIGIV